MRINIKKLLSGAVLIPAMAFVVGLTLQPQLVAAEGPTLKDGPGASQPENAPTCLFGTEDGCTGEPIFKTIANVLLFLIGAVSVIMLIYGGIRYVVSGGDSTAVQNAKNTILYAIVGIVVALLAFAIVNFIISSLADQ